MLDEICPRAGRALIEKGLTWDKRVTLPVEGRGDGRFALIAARNAH